MDEERERYTRIRERIESLVIALGSNKTDDGKLELENARRLLRVATGNTETLRYLETISCLENIFTDVTKAATVTAVGLSAEDSISQRALSSRFLTDNVKQCWDYTAQLSNLAAIQLKTAADFHIFNHEANEVRAHASQLKNLSEKQLEAFSPAGRIDEASNLADEMKARLSAFQSLSDRARVLASKAPSILPVENRLLEVRDGASGSSELGGPLMVQLLIDYVGSNFTVKKGESLPLIDTTENPYLWKVMTHNGPQYIPSIACIIASANGEQIHDAYKPLPHVNFLDPCYNISSRTLSTVKDAWNDAVENYRRQLAIYYTNYLEDVGQRGGLYTTDSNGKRRFLEDLDRLLIHADADEGHLANILEMLSGKAGKFHKHFFVSRPEQANEVWGRSELNLLHQPLLLLNEHVQSLRRVDENVDSYTNRMREYASTITSEARGLQAQLESLRMTHDRNRAELKELYDRVHNWKTAYTESLNGPTSGVGRLIISSVSSSSGISSEELPPIPIPPSPFGRITPVELSLTQEDEESDVEFLETRERKRPKMNVALLQAKDVSRNEKSTVFTCGANLHPRQTHGSLNVNQASAQKAKTFRDFPTQTTHRRVIQNTQTELTGNLVSCKFAGTQSESNRVDCMTQIGWIKAQKAQQVDGSIISAAMEVAESTPSSASAMGGATPDRAYETYTTGPAKGTTAYCETATSGVKKQDLIFQIGDARTLTGSESSTSNRKWGASELDAHSIDSGAFETHVATGRLNFETRKESRDIVTQIHSTRDTSNFGSQHNLECRTRESISRKGQPKQKESEIQVGSSELKTGNIEFSRTFSNTNLQTKTDRSSRKVETTPCSLKSCDVEAQIFHAPNIPRAYDGMQCRKCASHQNHVQGDSKEFKKDTSYCELNANDLALSDVDVQVSRPVLVEASVVNGMGKPKVVAECTCFEKASRETKDRKNLSMSHFCALHQPISFHFTPPCYAQCETPIRMQETSSFFTNQMVSRHTVSPRLAPKEVKISTVSAKPADRSFTERFWLEDAGTNTTSPTSRMNSREGAVTEFATPIRNTDVGSVSFPKKTADRSTTAPRLAAGTEAQITANRLQYGETEQFSGDSSFEPIHLAKCATKRVYSEVSCQVGTILKPEIMEISTVPLQLTEVDQSNHRDRNLNAVICPTRVFVNPVLTEEAGINVAKMQDMHHLNVKIADRMYDASVAQTSRMRAQQEVSHDKRQICTLEMNLKNEQMDNHTTTAPYSATEAGITITLNRQRQRHCHCQFETSHVDSAILETSTSRAPPSAISKSTQVGTTLTPTRVQIVGIGTKPKIPLEIGDFSAVVQNVVCPSTVELVSSLDETGGIKVKDISEVDAVNILVEGSTFYANASNRMHHGSVDHSKEELTPDKTKPTAKKSGICHASGEPLMQQARFEIVSTKVSELCNFCHGTGKRVAAQVNSQDRRATSTTSTAYQQPANQKIQGSKVANVECQVGAILRPTRVHVANVEIRPRTAELARQMGMTPNAIICPSTIELQTELAENSGIQVISAKDIGSMELVAGTSIFETSFCDRANDQRTESIPGRRSFMNNMNITCGESGLTLGQAQTENVMEKLATSTKTFTLHDVGCEFAVKSENIGTVCNQCHGKGRIKNLSMAFSPIESTSVDYSRKPSFIHQRASTPISKTAECQVGILLRPSTIEIGNISVKPRNRKVAEYLGMNVDSVLCPARVQMVPEIREAPGIEVINVTDVTRTEVQAGGIVVDADVQTRQSQQSSIATGTQKKPRLLLNIRNNGNGLTIGNSSSHVTKTNVATVCDSFTLNDIGCEVVLRNSSIGGVCASCQGSGRTVSVSMKTMPRVLETQGVETSHHYSTLMSNSMMTKPVLSETKSCQVGTVLTPTCVNVAKVEMHPKNTSVVSSGAIVYPAAVEVESRLLETSGIHIREVATMDSININSGGKSYMASTQTTPKSKMESCVLEIRSFHPEAVSGELATHQMAAESLASTGKFHLKSIGCEFRLKNATSTAPYPPSLAGALEFREPVEVGSKRPTDSQGTDASCQVGLTLIPSTVEVADMTVSVRDEHVAANLGLKADAIICPSTIELETKLTETAGVTVTDVKDVKEIGITVGDRKGIVDVIGRKVRVQKVGATSRSMEPIYLSFTSRSPTCVQDTDAKFSKAWETTTTQVHKPIINQDFRCTFRIKQTSELSNPSPMSSPQVKSLQVNSGKEDVSCQVGVTMVPCKINVSPIKVVVEERSSADAMGISEPSGLQPTICEMESRISEKSGIAIAQIDTVEQLQLQIKDEIYNASVVGGSTKPKTTATTSSWASKPTPISITGYPRMDVHVTSSIQRSDVGLSNAIGPYLVTMKESRVQKKSILEVGALTLGGKSLQLSVDGDLRGKLTMQTTRQPSSSGQKPAIYTDSFQRLRSPINPEDRLLPRRPNSRLCDVACEALIKPETLEKRLQTVFI
ncbi:unnamed protein product [Hydatigera taeniaeformis]|uniref:Desmoplakin SH3 domain-containing protein n=1 Tax=Hydatigena taeniaeformis TaxID=6205 RepID=A0A3P7FZW6_HYDTA|nr:unnamed protein product [Hydatigera taeniaeformis]